MDAFASGRDKLAGLRSLRGDGDDINEATTRLRYIDVLLQDCLGWLPREIVAESYSGGDYVDYAIGAPAVAMIVEAKREGATFELPAGIAGRRSVSLPTLFQDAGTRAAIEQVTAYCQKRGVPIAVVANGHQLVAFYASRQDGRAPYSGEALVYSSLDEMHDDFASLWAHLSRPGIAERNLQRALLGAASAPLPPPKLSDQIPDYPGFRQRSPMETDLKILGGLFIQDLEDSASVSDDFVRDCYCNGGALSQYAMVSTEILRAKYSSTAAAAEVQVEPVRSKNGPNPALTADLLASALTRRPLVLLGDVGVGKSMFLQHLIRVEAASALANAVLLSVDYGREPALAQSLEDFTSRRITDQLRETFELDIDEGAFVRAVYNGELNALRRSYYGELAESDPAAYKRREIARLDELTSDRSEHIRRSLEHLRGTQKRHVVIVLDNIDQRPADFQERVFLIAQSFAQTWPSTVFVALRPSTFYQSRSSGTLSAYQPRVFTVSPARTDQVVARRLQYARTQIHQSTVNHVFPENLSLSGEDLGTYIDALILAFDGNEELKRMLDNLSGGNLRQALTFLSSFVGSGYVSTQRVLDTAAQGGRYVVPIHEFVRSVLYGDYEFFDPRSSEIANLFDILSNDQKEHFLLPLILAMVQRRGESVGTNGYVDVPDIYLLAQSAGFSQEQTAPHIERALAKRLLEAPLGRSTDGPVRITTVGAYMYQSLITDFAYLDAVVVDTPIVDTFRRAGIRAESNIAARLIRAVDFLDYLDIAWQPLSGSQFDFDWTALSLRARQQVTQIRQRSEAAAERARAH